MNIISEYMRYVMEVTFGIPSLYGNLGSIFAAQGSCIGSTYIEGSGSSLCAFVHVCACK